MAIVFAGVVTSCEGDTPGGESGDADPPAIAPEPEPDPDRRIRVALRTTSEELVQRYAETARQHRKLRTELAAYEKRHQRHLTVLAELWERADSARGATPTPTPSGKATPPRVEVPGRAGKAVRALVGAERAAANDRTDVLGDIADPELARVVASIVACGKTHVSELDELAGRDD